MITKNIIAGMTETLALESKCVLGYVVSATWPTVIDKADEDAQQLFADAWAAEEGYVDELMDMIAELGSSPQLYGTYRFAPARLNFSRPTHLMGVVPPLIEEEIEWLREASQEVAETSPFGKYLARLTATKEEWKSKIEEAYTAFEEARAAAAEAGGDAAAAGAGSDDPMAFRDADMDIEDRLEVTANQSVEMKLWAAMAQTDCTACGYDCEGYAKAIASGEDTDLTKCVPGEDETASAIKSILGK